MNLLIRPIWEGHRRAVRRAEGVEKMGEELWRTAVEIQEQMNTVLVGKEDKVELTVLVLLAGGHLLLEDVPGVGKTTLANALARAVGCDFARIQFTPDTLPGDITGVSVYNMKQGTFEYVPGAVMHQIVLADEINRTAPKTQASLLEAMEEHQVTVDGVSHTIEEPFMVIATQNPIDFLGTYNLPEAQLDRFLMRISLGYPEAGEEKRMAEQFLSGGGRDSVRPVTGADGLRRMRDEVARVMVQKDVISYIVELCRATRECKELSLGASPRATLALLRASQAAAFLAGRDYVLPDDVQRLAAPVLAHRLVLSVSAKADRSSTEALVEGLLRKVRVPVL